MERPKPKEKVDAHQLRMGDLRTFWPGFEGFRNDYSEFEENVRTLIAKALKENNYQEDRASVATEAIMLFYYGVYLSRKMHPCFTKDDSPVNFKINAKTPTHSFYVYPYFDEQNRMRSYYGIGLKYVASLEKYPDPFFPPDFIDDSRTVSENLPDWLLVTLATAGAEEYGHSIFHKKKPLKYIKKAAREYEKVCDKHLTTSGDIEAAKVQYHITEVERRGLIWRHRLIRKYFPHWADETTKFTETINEIRYRNATNPRLRTVAKGRDILENVLDVLRNIVNIQ